MGRKKTSYEDVKMYFENFGYKLLSKEYIDSNKPLLIKCPNPHHKEYETSFNSFKNHNRRCRQCDNERKMASYEEIKDYIESFGYKLLTEKTMEKVKSTVKLLVKCPNEEHEPYKVAYNEFKNSESRCPYCARDKRRLSYEHVKEYIESFDYKLLSKEYKSCDEKLLIQCPNNHEPYEVTFENFKGSKCRKGTRCPYCNESKGEKKINEILEKRDIEFVKQYRFRDCKSKRTLPFDFYLPKYNICIEFDGEQHFKMREFFGGFDGFVKTKIRDTIKNEYCKKNNIKLIRIPYWEFDDIENIIVNELELE